MTGANEIIGGLGFFQVVLPYSTQMDLECPSIVVRKVEPINYSSIYADPPDGNVLYTQGKVVASYDPALGDGWANTPSIGWAWVRSYPWIFSPELGWLYCAGGHVITIEPYLITCVDCPPTTARDLTTWGAQTLAFWLWSSNTGEWIYRQNPPPDTP